MKQVKPNIFALKLKIYTTLMIAPSIPDNEKQRQKAVEKYNILDTLPEESFDTITSLISYICDTPISLITLLDHDRNFLKSHQGLPFNESPRAISFCGHAINSDDDITHIEDTRLDERFHDNPLVVDYGAVFYAGAPLVDPRGFKLGTLCVYDVKPRKLTAEQITAIKGMSKQVVRLFEERYQNLLLQELQEKLQQRNKNLEKFAAMVSHDLKSPLAQITSLAELIEADIKENHREDIFMYLEYIKKSSATLREYIDGVLKFYKAEQLLIKEKETIDILSFAIEIKNIFRADNSVTITHNTTLKLIEANKAALTQILVNLVSNAIKYNDTSNPIISLTFSESENYYIFSVKDNGPGIPEENHSEIFELFKTHIETDRFGNAGTGIGLATVKKVVHSLGGTITVSSQQGKGANFEFTVPKI